MQLQRALGAHRSADANQKALVYAPWVLNGMLLVVLREKAATLEASHWIGFFVYVVVLVMLGQAARKALAKQRERAESEVVLLIQAPRAFEELQRLMSDARFRGMKFSDTARQRIIDAGIRQARSEEQRRDEAARKARMREVPATRTEARRELMRTAG